MTDLRLDQTSALSIEAVDAAGNPGPAVIDAVVWTNSDDTAGTLTVTGDTASYRALVIGGSSTVSVTANVDGNPFSASVAYTGTAAKFVAAGIRIVESITPP